MDILIRKVASCAFAGVCFLALGISAPAAQSPPSDLTQLGTVIAAVPSPTGGGNPDIEVIRDGDKPPVGSGDSSRQFDTWDGNNAAAEDWIGYEYAGQQTFVMDGLRMRRPIGTPEHRVFYQANLIVGQVAKAVSKLSGTQGTMQVAPASTHRKDRWAAKLSMKVLDHVWDITDYEQFEEMAMLWAAITGSGYLKFTWNPQIGEPDRYYLDDDGKVTLPRTDTDRAEMDRKGQFNDMPPGELEIDITSPFAHYWDWNNKTPFIIS